MVLTGCEQSAASSDEALLQALRMTLGPGPSRDGAVLAINPATCGFDSGDVPALVAVAEAAGMPLKVIFFGVAGDSITHLRIRSDLNVIVPSEVIGEGEAEARFQVPNGSVPTLWIVRAGRVVMIAHGSALTRTERWLPPFLNLQGEGL
jgi:hypothetical protein